MVQSSELYNMLLDAIRADERGIVVEIDQFNRICKQANQEVYDFYISLFEKDTKNSSDLGGFQVLNYGIDLSTVSGDQVGSLPSNYYYLVGKPRITSDNTATGTIYRCDHVTVFEDAEREDNYLTRATLTYPTVRISGESATRDLQVRVRPSTVTKVWIDYFREIEVPYLDYIMSTTTYVKTFLPDTTTAQAVPEGYVHSGGTAGGVGVTVTSLTNDLEWHTSDVPMLLAKMIKKLGIAIPDEILTQAGMAEESKIETES